MAAAIDWVKKQTGRAPKPLLIAGGVVVALIAIWFLFFRGDQNLEPYRTVEADRGRVSRVVSATGTLQPLVSVNVGSTVSGLVEEVLVDYNSQVRAGQILARLEPDTFQQRMQQSRASLAQAQADYQVADSDYDRYARLAEEGFASEQLMAQQRAARARAAAQVSQASAALRGVTIDYERSIIRSPIDGVVVDRQINPGQSVAASFQAPTLFVIAQDLSRLQANITVDEADIGQVREGMPVRFNVDAFPDEDFEGGVRQVRQQGVDTNGVVSYTVVVRADNPGRRLLPGMTANAEIVVEETGEVARIPNTALRFRPGDPDLQRRARELQQNGAAQPAAAGDAVAQDASRNGQVRGGQIVERLTAQLQLTAQQQTTARTALQSARRTAANGSGDRRAAIRRARETVFAALEPTLNDAQKARLAEIRNGGASQTRETPTRAGVIYVLRDGRPEPIRVELGVADDSYTELRGGDLRDGDQIIIGGGPVDPNAAGQQQRSPFSGGGAIRIRGG